MFVTYRKCNCTVFFILIKHVIPFFYKYLRNLSCGKFISLQIECLMDMFKKLLKVFSYRV